MQGFIFFSVVKFFKCLLFFFQNFFSFAAAVVAAEDAVAFVAVAAGVEMSGKTWGMKLHSKRVEKM
jgi:hypothetical protein